jgi:hypothetical protein
MAISKTQQKKELKNRIIELENDIKTLTKLGVDQSKIDEVTNELNLLTSELALLDKPAGGISKEQKAIVTALQNEDGIWAYITGKQHFIHYRNRSENPAVANVQELVFSPTAAVQRFTKVAGLNHGDIGVNDLLNVFDKTGLSYDAVTASFDVKKWSTQDYFNTMSAKQRYFCDLSYAEEDLDYHESFDILMQSLGDRREENINFLETYLAYKRLYPERHINTPDLIMIGLCGGEGKGLYTSIAVSAFTSNAVSKMTTKQINGGFNALLRGAVMCVLDDQSKKDMPQEALLSLGGSETMVVEQKGVDAVNEDKCGNMMIMSNNPNIVRLAGTGISGVDRRWSYLVTSKTFMEEIKTYHQEKHGLLMTDVDAKEYAGKAAREVFSNRIEVGKWISAMIIKHGVDKMKTLLPLHGSDYRAAICGQKDVMTEIFERVVPDMLQKNGFIPLSIVKSIVEVESGVEVSKSRSHFSEKLEVWMRKTGIVFEKDKKRVQWLWDTEAGIPSSVGTQQTTVYRTRQKRDDFAFALNGILKRKPTTFDGTFIESEYLQEEFIDTDVEVIEQMTATGVTDDEGNMEYAPQSIVVRQKNTGTALQEMLAKLNMSK